MSLDETAEIADLGFVACSEAGRDFREHAVDEDFNARLFEPEGKGRPNAVEELGLVQDVLRD